MQRKCSNKREEMSHSDDENINDSNVEDERNQCSEPSKEQWPVRNKSCRKRKICVFKLNE